MKDKKVLLYVELLILAFALPYVEGFILKPQELKSISGILEGIDTSLIWISIVGILKFGFQDKNSSYQHKLNIEAKYELNVSISNKAKTKAFDVMILVMGPLMFMSTSMHTDLLITLLVVATNLIA